MNPLTVDRLINLLNKGVSDDSPAVLDSLILLFFSLETGQSDLYLLGSLISHKELLDVIKKFSGKKITLPTLKQYEETYIMAVLYYLKVFRGLNWEQINTLCEVPLELKNKMVKLANKALTLDDKIKKHFEDMLGQNNG